MEHELQIIPAIIPKHFRELEEKLEIIKGATEVVHVDICDGMFTQEASWPLGKPDENFRSIVNEERGMPFWEDFEFEFHLMVRDPFALVPDLIKAGAARIIIHAESLDLQNDRLLLDQLRTEGVVQVGIAFKLNTPIEDIKDFLPFADFIMFVAIEHLGFQGQVFNNKVIDKIKWLHSELPTMPIAVDGGLNLDTAPVAFDAGASKLVVGSYIVNSVSPVDAIRDLEGVI